MTRPSEAAAALRGVLDPAVADAGLHLEDVRVTSAGRRSVVRVTVDLPDGPGGVGSDLLAEVSRQISAALDDADVVPGAYTLEVSTPGVDRPLTTARHYRRATGRLVRVHATGGPLRGRVVSADDDHVVLDVEGTHREVALTDLTSGAVEPELGRPSDHDGQG